MAVLSPNEMFYTGFEPVQKNRFRVTIDGFESFLIKSFKIPRPKSSTVVIDHINIQRKVKGKTTIGGWSMMVYNSIEPSSSQIIAEWQRLHHEYGGRDGYSDFYKKDIIIEILDPVGFVISRYIVKGAFLTDEGDLDFDYAGEGLVDLPLSGECDYCELDF